MGYELHIVRRKIFEDFEEDSIELEILNSNYI